MTPKYSKIVLGDGANSVAWRWPLTTPIPRTTSSAASSVNSPPSTVRSARMPGAGIVTRRAHKIPVGMSNATLSTTANT
jgi:hypothetical protein